MSIKSLLQFILLLLIFLIIGGIYFLYFYSGPLKKTNFINTEINDIKKNKIEINKSTDQDVLEDTLLSKNDAEKNLKSEETSTKKNIKENKNINENINDLEKNKENSKIENLTKEIEYITSNRNGDIFKISAKYGKTNIESSNILDLEIVDGIISSSDRPDIFITSDFAEYNYNNQNSKFYRNVVIKYDNKVITCDNLDLSISENIAVAYSNVTVKDEKSVMKAQVLTLDIVTKDININSENKIKIYTN